ncbi:MAG: tetratricopeptide repeat protein [Magnetococcales bacterium]|nr:tetratricopeptide repeat protein [Magnetococcales bacterium]
MSRSGEHAKIYELVKASEKLFNYEMDLDAEELASLKKEAEAFLPSHGIIAHLVLARVACLNNDLDAMRQHHAVILEMSPDDPAGYRDYSDSLRKLGYYSEAREMARRAYELHPNDGELLRLLLKSCVISGLFQASWRYLDLVIKSNARIMTREYNFLTAAVQFFRETDISDAELERLQQITLAVLRLEELVPIGALRSPAVHMELLHAAPDPTGMNTSSPQQFLMWGIQTSVQGDRLGMLNERLCQTISRSQLTQQILTHVKIRFFHRTRDGMLSTGFNF